MKSNKDKKDNLVENNMYKNIDFRRDMCTASKQASDTVLSLPIYVWPEDFELDYIIKTVKDAL